MWRKALLLVVIFLLILLSLSSSSVLAQESLSNEKLYVIREMPSSSSFNVTFKVRLIVYNKNISNATNITLQEHVNSSWIDDGGEIVRYGGGSYDSNTKTITWSIGNLTPYEFTFVVYELKAPENKTGNYTFYSNASYYSPSLVNVNETTQNFTIEVINGSHFDFDLDLNVSEQGIQKEIPPNREENFSLIVKPLNIENLTYTDADGSTTVRSTLNETRLAKIRITLPEEFNVTSAGSGSLSTDSSGRKIITWNGNLTISNKTYFNFTSYAEEVGDYFIEVNGSHRSVTYVDDLEPDWSVSDSGGNGSGGTNLIKTHIFRKPLNVGSDAYISRIDVYVSYNGATGSGYVNVSNITISQRNVPWEGWDGKTLTQADGLNETSYQVVLNALRASGSTGTTTTTVYKIRYTWTWSEETEETKKLFVHVPGVKVTNVSTSPGEIEPGDSTDINVTLKNFMNVSSGEINVSVTIFYPNGTLLWSSGNNTLPSLSSGEENSTVFSYTFPDSAPTGNYTVKACAYWNNEYSVGYGNIELVEAIIELSLYPAILLPNSSGNLTVTVTNLWSGNITQVNITNVSITPLTWGIQNLTPTFLGNIIPNGNKSAVYNITAPSTLGIYNLSVTVKYFDPRGNPKTKVENTTVKVSGKDVSITISPIFALMFPTQTKPIRVEVENVGGGFLNGSVNLTPPSGWSIVNTSSKNFTNLAPLESFYVYFDLTAPSSAEIGEIYYLNATVVYDNSSKYKTSRVRIIEKPVFKISIVTDKAVYLLDPYLWVYEAPDNLWPNSGHALNVTITAMVVDEYGHLVPNQLYENVTVTYEVYNSTPAKFASGNMSLVRRGFYSAIVELNESNANLSQATSADFEIRVNVSIGGVSSNQSSSFRVGRWGCDSCHWPDPTNTPGGGSNQHTWSFLLGGGGTLTNYFNITYLRNAELTHTPEDPGVDNNHESLSSKGGGGGGRNCSVCHYGSYVMCTECHGYSTTNAGYILGEHDNVEAPTGFLSCSNSSCHGHINDTQPNDIDNDEPACTSCHPISYTQSFVAYGKTYNITNITSLPSHYNPRAHPANIDSILTSVVNCSFCHNPFHNILNQSATPNCASCHNYSFANYTKHNESASGGVACYDCHGNGSYFDYHYTKIKTCKQCHTNWSIINDSYSKADAFVNASYFDMSVHYIQNDEDVLLAYPYEASRKREGCEICHFGSLEANKYAGVSYPQALPPYYKGAQHSNSSQIVKPECSQCHAGPHNVTYTSESALDEIKQVLTWVFNLTKVGG